MTLDVAYGVMIIEATVFTAASVGFVASLLLALLIRDMGKWNDFIYLVYYMTIFQLLYDVLLTSYAFPPITTTVIFLRGLAFFFSLISYLISTVMSYTVFHVLHYKVIFDLFRWKWLIGLIVTTPALVMIILICYGLFTNDFVILQDGFLMGTYSRLSCACINAIFFILYKYQVYKLTNLRMDKLTDSDIAMRCLVDRMKWYPIVQICARILPTIDQLTNGHNVVFYVDTTKPPFYFSLCTTISTSIAPIGFLIIFLYMQPKAYNHAKKRFWGLFTCQNHPSLAEAEVFNDSSSPQYKHSSDKNMSPKTNNTNAPISRVVAEESEVDWDNRAMASVNIIRDNEESYFEDSEPNAITGTSSGNRTSFNYANKSIELLPNISNTSRPIEVISSKTAVEYSGSSSQQLREIQIENLNDDELISLATDSGISVSSSSPRNNHNASKPAIVDSDNL